LDIWALDQQTSNLFYQVISTRHSQKRSTIITTNTPFSDWGNILFNTTIATAIADRLVEKLRDSSCSVATVCAKANKPPGSAGRVVGAGCKHAAALWRYSAPEESAG